MTYLLLIVFAQAENYVTFAASVSLPLRRKYRVRPSLEVFPELRQFALKILTIIDWSSGHSHLSKSLFCFTVYKKCMTILTINYLSFEENTQGICYAAFLFYSFTAWHFATKRQNSLNFYIFLGKMIAAVITDWKMSKCAQCEHARTLQVFGTP